MRQGPSKTTFIRLGGPSVLPLLGVTNFLDRIGSLETCPNAATAHELPTGRCALTLYYDHDYVFMCQDKEVVNPKYRQKHVFQGCYRIILMMRYFVKGFLDFFQVDYSINGLVIFLRYM